MVLPSSHSPNGIQSIAGNEGGSVRPTVALQNTMFDVPSDLDVTRVVVTPESVGGSESPRIIRKKH